MWLSIMAAVPFFLFNSKMIKTQEGSRESNRRMKLNQVLGLPRLNQKDIGGSTRGQQAFSHSILFHDD
jgi:hypothetical protein